MSLRGWTRSRPGLSSALGVVFAVIAAMLLLGYITNLPGSGGGGRAVSFPVARRDIEAGALIDRDDVSDRTIPADYLVPGTITGSREVVGRRALRFIARGEPFTDSSVSGRGNETLASRIPADLRAYSIQPGRGPGPGPELRAGDRVDVLTTWGDPPSTRTLLKERLVLLVRRGGAGEAVGAPSVTLLVTPAEAEMLAQSECTGEISLSLCPMRKE